MPVLFQNFRANHYSRRHTVYSKIKRVTDNGYDTSNDFFGNNFTGNLLGLNDNSKDFFSNSCSDIIYSSELDALIACGANVNGDSRSNLSTFMYSTNNGVSWAFAKDTFPAQSNGYNGAGEILAISDGVLFCGGTGGTAGNFVSLMKSSDGDNWQATSCSLSRVMSMATSGDGEILVWGQDSSYSHKLLLSTDNGDTFNEINYDTVLTSLPVSVGSVYHINNLFYFIVTQNTGAVAVFTISITDANTGGTDISNWTDITGNFSGANGNITLEGYNTSMYYDGDNENTFMLFGGTSHFVFYSTDGSNFTDLPLDNPHIKQARKIVYVPPSDGTTVGTYYLGIVYPENTLEPGNYTFMYSSPTDNINWSNFLNTNDINSNVDSLKNIKNISGVYDFYLEANTLYLVVTNGVTTRGNHQGYEYHGLIELDLVSGLNNNPVDKTGTVSKMIYSNPNLIVAVTSSSERFTNDDTIYYQGPNDTSLQETEHQDDTN